MSSDPFDVPGLFDAAPFEVASEPAVDPDLSPDRRRTARQRANIDAGIHPLTRGPLHEYATPETARPGVSVSAPFTCGSCRFRVLVRQHGRAFPKCLRDVTYGGHDAASVTIEQVANVSRSAATDVRAWWPACAGYEAGDRSVGPDAARSVPSPGAE